MCPGSREAGPAEASQWTECLADSGATNGQRRRYLRRAQGRQQNRDLSEQQHDEATPNHIGWIQTDHFEAANQPNVQGNGQKNAD